MTASVQSSRPSSTAVYPVLLAISVGHLINDTLQSLLAGIYPILKTELSLNYTQIGLITLAFQLTASVLQPVIGAVTDRKPMPYSLPVGSCLTLLGMLLLATAHNFYAVLVAAMFVGLGSSIFHPESSRVARLASGGQLGMAQSLFQLGGNVGTSIGPLLAAFVVLPFGQWSISLFALLAVVSAFLLTGVSRWYARHLRPKAGVQRAAAPAATGLTPWQTWGAIGILMVLMFSKFVYTTSLSSFLPLYLIDRFGVTVQSSQLYLFVFLAAVAAGTFIGGPIGDRYGRKFVIWLSILGALPFTLVLPHVSLTWAVILTIPIGFILASAFSTIVVFAQELVPGNVGMISGLFFGFAFGAGGIGAALLGFLADQSSIGFVYQVCAFLPALGLLTWFLPDIDRKPA
jgi:MFS transporter, FSR family, fosmidomycin resistance protein